MTLPMYRKLTPGTIQKSSCSVVFWQFWQSRVSAGARLTFFEGILFEKNIQDPPVLTGRGIGRDLSRLSREQSPTGRPGSLEGRGRAWAHGREVRRGSHHMHLHGLERVLQD